MNKEEIYDTNIRPLMREIIRICKDNGIAMCMSVAIPIPEDDDLQCTTSIPDESGSLPPHMKAAMNELCGGRSSLITNITTEKADGSRVMETFIG